MAKGKLLIVEDETDLRTLLSEQLEEVADSIVLAEDGLVALGMVQSTIFDTILTDLVMPNMTGLAFVKKLRELGLQTPVVILTGNGDIEKAIEAIRYGAFDFLKKPCQQEDLKDVIGRALELGRELNYWTGDSEVLQPLEKVKQESQGRSVSVLQQALVQVTKKSIANKNRPS